MKNRILWIFEGGDEPERAPENVADLNKADDINAAGSSDEQAPFVAIPWALFGSLAEDERETMHQVYRRAFEQTQSQLADQANLNEEMERFNRLLAGVNVGDSIEEY